MSTIAPQAPETDAPTAATGRSETDAGPARRVWLLMGDRAGDNSQILGLGESLGWPLETKHFVYRPYEKLVNFPFTRTLAGVIREESSELEPPWPELVISAGRRNEPIARWIRTQAQKDGGDVKLVHVGRPWARIERFDLVITTPQYRLPDLPNVLHNDAPLHRVNEKRLAPERSAWEPRLAHLPRPRFAILAGGASGPYPFDVRSGAKLGREVNRMAREAGGSILLTTSARTPEPTTDAMVAEIDQPAEIFRWRADAPENPFFGYLATADVLVVTADSVSMMAEACSTGRPVYLYDTGEGVTSMRRDIEAQRDADEPVRWMSRQHRKALVYRTTMKLGPQRLTRDIRIVQQFLVSSGRATWLGDGEAPQHPPPLRDMERAVERVRVLFV